MTRRDAAGQFRKARTLTEWVGAVLRRRARDRRLDARLRVLLPGGCWVPPNAGVTGGGTPYPARSCSACGKTPDTDMGVCEWCDELLCDDCGVHSHRYVFCSQKCADEWLYTWGEDVMPNAEGQPRRVAT